MAVITIRNLEDHLKRNLRLRAAQHGCSMEQEARSILAQALAVAQPPDGAAWLAQVRQRFQGLASDDWAPPSRDDTPDRALPSFDA